MVDMGLVVGKEAYTDEQIREMWPRFLENSFSEKPWVPKLIAWCDVVDVVNCLRMYNIIGLINLIMQTKKDRFSELTYSITASLVPEGTPEGWYDETLKVIMPEGTPERWYDEIFGVIRRKLEITGYGFIRKGISTEHDPLRWIVFLRSFVYKLSKKEIPKLGCQERDDFKNTLDQLYGFLERNYCTYKESNLESIYYDLVEDLPNSQREYIDWYCSSGPRIIEWPCFPWPKNYKLYLSPEEERIEEALYCNLVVRGFPRVRKQIEEIIAADNTNTKHWYL